MAISATQVRSHRQNLNKIEKGLDKLNPGREVSLSKTALQESIMFLGLVLGDIGENTPYVKSNDKTSKEIDPRADESLFDFNFDATDYVGQVKEIREELEGLIKVSVEIYSVAPGSSTSPFFASHLTMHVMNLKRARMWLGMALNEYKNRIEKLAADVDEKASLSKA